MAFLRKMFNSQFLVRLLIIFAICGTVDANLSGIFFCGVMPTAVCQFQEDVLTLFSGLILIGWCVYWFDFGWRKYTRSCCLILSAARRRVREIQDWSARGRGIARIETHTAEMLNAGINYEPSTGVHVGPPSRANTNPIPATRTRTPARTSFTARDQSNSLPPIQEVDEEDVECALENTR